MSSASMTKIFCAANKHFVRFAVDRVNRDSIICPNGQNYCAVQFFNDVMYLGIAVAKTKRLN